MTKPTAAELLAKIKAKKAQAAEPEPKKVEAPVVEVKSVEPIVAPVVAPVVPQVITQAQAQGKVFFYEKMPNLQLTLGNNTVIRFSHGVYGATDAYEIEQLTKLAEANPTYLTK